MVLAVRKAEKIRRNNASIKIQKTYRMYLQRKKYNKIRKATITIQNAIQQKKSKSQLAVLRKNQFATILQSAARAFFQR